VGLGGRVGQAGGVVQGGRGGRSGMYAPPSRGGGGAGEQPRVYQVWRGSNVSARFLSRFI
jgi:hypothetical protein